ncbi:uncharacterized protein LOC132256904 [Phlebotomus argentipes]|uniref:uncharacterized protein LOC132256904 n=1 Tax=Phlebotomus argentipes TaxID=94469 RepID=UPI0028935389|nr:uncharacterized protein LOC132256904 [Phlebotomus argentipes]
MDPNVVLRKFVDLCNSRQSDQISLYFASNGIVDWYGRTLKGPRKITDFFRFNNQYNHNFADGKQCSPFESRETHNSTRQIPPENLTEPSEDRTSAADSAEASSDNVPSSSGFLTPPQQSGAMPPLPALTQGRVFRKMSSSDDEDDGLCSVRKFQADLEESSTSGLVSMESQGSVSLSRKRTASVDSDVPKKRFKDADCDSGVVEGGDCGQLTDLYSELRHIEAFGRLEMVRRTKHRGVHATPSTSHGDSLNSSHFLERSDASPEATSSQWVKETKLNISYRLHRNQSDIQFALVVYENLTKRPTTRRNLINEFGSLDVDKTPKSVSPRGKKPDKVRKCVTAKKPLRF